MYRGFKDAARDPDTDGEPPTPKKGLVLSHVPLTFLMIFNVSLSREKGLILFMMAETQAYVVVFCHPRLLKEYPLAPPANEHGVLHIRWYHQPAQHDHLSQGKHDYWM